MSEACPPPLRQALRENCWDMVRQSGQYKLEAQALADDATSVRKQNRIEREKLELMRKSEKAWEILSLGVLFGTFCTGLFTAVAVGAVMRFYGVI